MILQLLLGLLLVLLVIYLTRDTKGKTQKLARTFFRNVPYGERPNHGYSSVDTNAEGGSAEGGSAEGDEKEDFLWGPRRWRCRCGRWGRGYHGWCRCGNRWSPQWYY